MFLSLSGFAFSYKSTKTQSSTKLSINRIV